MSRILDIGDAGPLECNLGFITGAAALEGTLYKNGEPIKEGVTLEVAHDGAVVKFGTWPNADGNFVLNGVPDGPAVLKAGTWFLDDVIQEITLVAGQTTQQDLYILGGSQELHPNIQNVPQHWPLTLILLKQPQEFELRTPAALDNLWSNAIRVVGFLASNINDGFYWRDLKPGSYHLLGIAAPQWTAEGLAQAVTTSTPVEIADGQEPQTVTLSF